MKPAHLAYLNLVPDNQQLPAVRCSMAAELDGDICMYGKSASSGVESMNRANDDIRRRTAIDILNAALVLIKKESMRFHRAQSDAHKREVWSEEKPLTPRGMSVMEDLFKKCDPSIYHIQLTKTPSHHCFVILKKSAAMREYKVEIPKEGLVHGSRFGTCTCGFPTKEGLPCDHMVFIVKVGLIPNLTRVQIMLFWYTRAQWRLQYPQDAVCRADVTLVSIKKSGRKDLLVSYCPSWVAPRKKGRPKKEARKLGIANHVEQGAGKKRRCNKDATSENAGENVEDNVGIGDFDEIKVEDTKDGIIGEI